VARNIDVTEYTKYVDSIQFCLSKGLSCPIGSIIAGTQDYIETAIKWRKMLGGGWRQAGIIASMGIAALEKPWINRLQEDHQLAKNLKHLLSQTDLPINIPEPDTNLLMIEVPDHVIMPKLVQSLAEVGIRTHDMGQRIRIVTHSGINSNDIEYSAEIITDIFRKNM